MPMPLSALLTKQDGTAFLIFHLHSSEAGNVLHAHVSGKSLHHYRGQSGENLSQRALKWFGLEGTLKIT